MAPRSFLDPASLPPAGRATNAGMCVGRWELCERRGNSQDKLTETPDFVGKFDWVAAGSPTRRPQEIPASLGDVGRPMHTVKLPPKVALQRPARDAPLGAAPTANPGLAFSSHLNANGVASTFRPTRVSNPLAPIYAPLGGTFPPGTGTGSLAAFGPELSPRPFRRDPLNVADIPGCRPRLFHRARDNPRYGDLDYTRNYLDYSDVERSQPAAGVRQPLKTQLEPIDVGRLSLWSAQGDTGRLLRSKRPELGPSNPLDPSYVYNTSAEARWQAERAIKASAVAAQQSGAEGRARLEGPPTGELVKRIDALAHAGHGGTSPTRAGRYPRASGMSNLFSTVVAMDPGARSHTLDHDAPMVRSMDRSRTDGFHRLRPTLTVGRKDLLR